MTNLGWYTGLQEVGPLVVLILAPWLVQVWTVSAVLLLASALCLLALMPALLLPRYQPEHRNKAHVRLPWPNAWHRLTFMVCLLFDGVWTVVLAPVLVLSGLSVAGALTVTAWLLVSKRVFNLLLGLLAVRFNPFQRERIWLGAALLAMLAGGGALAAGWIIAGSVFAIVGHGLFMILVPKRLADQATDGTAVQDSLNRFTFWRDLAAAVGALMASGLLAWQWTGSFYGLLTLVVLVMVWSVARADSRPTV
ncbi:MAG: MFS transporter, partial [Natronospirillum sp.]